MKLSRLIPLLLVGACTGDPTGIGAGDVRVTISMEPGVPEPEHNVTVQVRNDGDRTIYVLNDCGNLVAWHIERRVAGEWVDDPYRIYCFGYIPPEALEPGESASSSVPIHAPGRYRATVRVVTSPDAEEASELPEEFTVGS